MIMTADRRNRAWQDGSSPDNGNEGIFQIGKGEGAAAPAPVDFEYIAADLHAANRRRAELFRQAVMADRVMDVMLTALIAHEQGTVLTRRAAAMANRLPIEDASALIGDLIEARFLEAGDAADQIKLTELGVDRMRDYIRLVRGLPGLSR